MKTEDIALFLAILVVIVYIMAIVIVLNNNDDHDVDEVNDNKVPSQCDKFNGKAFLETGGSQNPQNITDIIRENQRLRWLCDGGVRS